MHEQEVAQEVLARQEHANRRKNTQTAARTRKPPQEVKMSCFCGSPAKTFETQEVESLTARSRKKLKI